MLTKPFTGGAKETLAFLMDKCLCCFPPSDYQTREELNFRHI